MRLRPEQIRDILYARSQGEARSAVAARFGVDPSTVRYHEESFERTYGVSATIYTLVKPVQRVCTHPSLKCLVCGQAQDHIHRRELEEIQHLKADLAAVYRKLNDLGYLVEPIGYNECNGTADHTP
jgi:hypothetical protein